MFLFISFFLDNQNNLIQNGLSIDPRYSAVYGNPYLRQSNNALPPLPPPSTANPSATPAPPPYNSVTRGQGGHVMGMSPGSAAHLLTKSSSSNLSNSNLAINNNSNNNTLNSNSNIMSNNNNMTTSSLNITNHLGSSNMASPSSGSNSTTTSTGQFILPSNGTFKKTGSLATHV